MRLGGREGGDKRRWKQMVEEKQNESKIQAKLGAVRWRSGEQHTQSSGPQRTIKERRGGGEERRDRDRVHEDCIGH